MPPPSPVRRRATSGRRAPTLLEQDKLDGSPGRPGIVLFDELEKASPEVVHALLNVLDNGLLRVASGERTLPFPQHPGVHDQQSLRP